MAGKKEEKEGGIGDVIKKVVSIGIGAAFMTEDAVKGILSDLPLPKDIISGLIQNAKGAKEDFSRGIRDEIRSYLTKMDVSKLIDDLVTRYDFEVQAQIRFKKKEAGKDVTSKDE